jgi:hypothetical protein
MEAAMAESLAMQKSIAESLAIQPAIAEPAIETTQHEAKEVEEVPEIKTSGVYDRAHYYHVRSLEKFRPPPSRSSREDASSSTAREVLPPAEPPLTSEQKRCLEQHMSTFEWNLCTSTLHGPLLANKVIDMDLVKVLLDTKSSVERVGRLFSSITTARQYVDFHRVLMNHDVNLAALLAPGL